MLIPIITSRFNNATWDENLHYRSKHHDIACIYGSPQRITDKIPLNSIVFVIEMNNQTNKILGIGLIRNSIANIDKPCRVYDTGNYNRYVYMSKYHLDREVIEAYNPDLVSMFDYILFKGKTHLKRGSGFTSISDKLYKNKICQCRRINRATSRRAHNYRDLRNNSRSSCITEKDISITSQGNNAFLNTRTTRII